MAKKDSRKVAEPFLTAVARRIGQAAGSLTKVTHGFTTQVESAEAISAGPSAAGAGQTQKKSPAVKGTSVTPPARRNRRPKKTAGTPPRQASAGTARKKRSGGKRTARIKSSKRK